MNLRCKVCGEKAAGFHFGAFTCEGCKSFFGRCCNNMSIIGECRNNKECIIDKKNRTSCKACRLQKCLLVGMSKSGSRYGRRSNWFKQYFQENEHQTKLLNKESDSDQHHHLKSVNTIEHLSQIDRVSSLTSKTADTYRNTFTDIDPQKKISFDLCATQPLISSHLYLNYFPQLGLNRFVSYKQGVGESAFYVPNTIPFSTLLRSETNVNDYFEKLLVAKYDDGATLPDTAANDDPLDLSQKHENDEKRKPQHHRTSSIEQLENEISKKALPLDLSVK